MNQSQKWMQLGIMTVVTIALLVWWRANFFPWGIVILALIALIWIRTIWAGTS
jgi:hypothetical protein